MGREDILESLKVYEDPTVQRNKCIQLRYEYTWRVRLSELLALLPFAPDLYCPITFLEIQVRRVLL